MMMKKKKKNSTHLGENKSPGWHSETINAMKNKHELGGLFYEDSIRKNFDFNFDSSTCRVPTGHGNPGKSWNFTISFSRPGKSWNVNTGLARVLLIPGTGNGERGTGNGSLGTSAQR